MHKLLAIALASTVCLAMAGPAFAGCVGKATGCSGSCLRFCIYTGFYRVPCVSLGEDPDGVHICDCQ